MKIILRIMRLKILVVILALYFVEESNARGVKVVEAQDLEVAQVLKAGTYY